MYTSTSRRMCLYGELYCNIQEGNLERVKELIEGGLNPAHGFNEPTIIASQYGRLDILKYLVAKGVTLLSWELSSAAGGGHLSTLEFILTSPHINLSEYGNRTIKSAYDNKKTTIVARLLYHESQIQETLSEELYMTYHKEVLSKLRPIVHKCSLFIKYPIPIIMEIMEQLVEFAIYVPYHIKWNMIFAIKHSTLSGNKDFEHLY